LVSPAGQTLQLTSGQWQVEDKLLEVDLARKVIYFVGTKDGPLEKHLYAVSMEQPDLIWRLTQPGHSYSGNTPGTALRITKEGAVFVSKYSSVKQAPRVELFKVVYSDNQMNVLPMAAVRMHIPSIEHPFPLNTPELFNFTNSDGLTIYGALYKPANYDSTKRYPTVLYVYGGPHVQLVANDYERMVSRFEKFPMYNYLGFVVVVIDGVGSSGRGLEFEGHLKHKMGTVEIRDQIEGLTYLTQKGIVDPARICVTGWSYGGYLSLMALGQRPDFFKMAISGAPVTFWEAYDTGYTERYMGTPEINPDGYKQGSVLSYVGAFPDDGDRLVIAHGMKDENVHFCNTSKFIEALVEKGKPYTLFVYPKERHGLRNNTNANHFELQVLSALSKL
jgi:dipeptidyl-peptidase 9